LFNLQTSFLLFFQFLQTLRRTQTSHHLRPQQRKLSVLNRSS